MFYDQFVDKYSYVFNFMLFAKDVPLGSLARFDSHHLDHCGCNIIGIGNKDRGMLSFRIVLSFSNSGMY